MSFKFKNFIRKLFPRTQVYGSLEEYLIHNPPDPNWKEKFKPRSYYSSDGQCVFFYLEPVDEYYSKWISPDITLYLTFGDNRIIGGMITCKNPS